MSMRHRGIVVLAIMALASVTFAEDDQKEEPCYVAVPAGLVLRAAPARSAAQLVVLPYGTRLDVSERSSNQDTIDGMTSPWGKVERDGKTGWVWLGFARKHGERAPDAVANAFLDALTKQVETTGEVTLYGGDTFNGMIQAAAKIDFVLQRGWKCQKPWFMFPGTLETCPECKRPLGKATVAAEGGLIGMWSRAGSGIRMIFHAERSRIVSSDTVHAHEYRQAKLPKVIFHSFRVVIGFMWETPVLGLAIDGGDGDRLERSLQWVREKRKAK